MCSSDLKTGANVVSLKKGKEAKFTYKVKIPANSSLGKVWTNTANEGVLSTSVLETATHLRRGRLESMLKVLDVDGAVRRVRGGWRATGRPWVYDAERYARVEAARADEQGLMLAYEHLSAPQCRMAFLRGVLDDPDLEPAWRCGSCDLCGGLDLSPTASREEVAAARRSLDRVGVVVEPRR